MRATVSPDAEFFAFFAKIAEGYPVQAITSLWWCVRAKPCTHEYEDALSQPPGIESIFSRGPGNNLLQKSVYYSKAKKETMKCGVSKEELLMIAGCVWFFAGANVVHIGVKNWLNTDVHEGLKVAGAIAVFFVFYRFIFRRLYHKYTFRIANKKGKLHTPLSIFDRKGWYIMFFMISLGIFIRTFGLLPDSVLAAFYVGLGGALASTGLLFVRRWWRGRRQNAPL